jgi:hypothetical protein
MVRLGTNLGTGHRCRTGLFGMGSIMSKDKDADHKGPRSSESRVKILRRELVDLESDLERARRRRDKAQARLEALEAIAEQLASAIASAQATDDARRALRDAADAAAVAVGQPEPAPKAPKAARRSKVAKVPDVIPEPELDNETPIRLTRRRSRRGDVPDAGSEVITEVDEVL